MKKELVFNNEHNNYYINKYSFNINDIDTVK